MQALTLSEQRQLLRDVKEIKKLLQIRGSVSQWVDINEAEQITGLKARSIRDKANEGIFNKQITGKKHRFLRTDLEKYSNENSTLNK